MLTILFTKFFYFGSKEKSVWNHFTYLWMFSSSKWTSFYENFIVTREFKCFKAKSLPMVFSIPEKIMKALWVLFHCQMKFSFQATISVLQTVVRRHLGDDVPNLYEISKNVSFILQNGHVSVSYPRPFMPNVAEIACIHCKPAQPLPKVSSNCFTDWRYLSVEERKKSVRLNVLWFIMIFKLEFLRNCNIFNWIRI